jgi:hypothetical protein
MFAFESTFSWHAARQAPGEKHRHSRSVNMRQAAPIASHKRWCATAALILKQSSGAKAPRRLKPALP